MRCLWDGSRRQSPAGPAWQVRNRVCDQLMMVAQRLDQGRVYVHPRGGRMLPAAQVFARDHQMRSRVVSGFAGFAPNVRAVWVDENEQLMIVTQQNDQLGIQQFDVTGRLVNAVRYDFDFISSLAGSVALVDDTAVEDDRRVEELDSWIATPGGWCTHSGMSLLEFSREGDCWLAVAKLPRPAVRLTMTRHANDARYVACLERGARIWFGDVTQDDAVTFAEHLRAPWATFLGDGRLVAADEQCVECFSATTSRSFRHVGSLPLPGGRPIALASLARNDQAGLVTDRGEVLVLQFST